MITPLTLGRVRHALSGLSPREPALPRRAASVALILRDLGPGFEILLIRRAERPGDPWAGHMALPGGHRQPGDADLRATVEREVLEEVGLPLAVTGDLLGQLPCVAPSVEGRAIDLVIVPFVFHLTTEPSTRANEEVDEIIWASLGPLAARNQDSSVIVTRDGQARSMPAWLVGERPVWGLTRRILCSFFDLLSSGAEG